MTEPIARKEARIEAALTNLGAEHEPPPGWEARVLAATATQHEPPLGWEARVLAATATHPRRRWWWFAIPAVALAASVLVIVPRSRGEDLQLAVEIGESSTPVRGSSAHLGQVVHATVAGGKHEHAVWVYHNERLVVACPGGSQCRSSDDAVIADVTLTAMGTYTIVALTASSALPVPTGALDGDFEIVHRAGVTETHQSLTVR